MGNNKAARFTESAIALIQSTSIQQWARSAHNLPIITKMAGEILAKNPKAKPMCFATHLTLIAMG